MGKTNKIIYTVNKEYAHTLRQGENKGKDRHPGKIQKLSVYGSVCVCVCQQIDTKGWKEWVRSVTVYLGLLSTS